MPVKVRRASGAGRDRNGGRHHAPAVPESGAVEKLLASAYQEGSAAGDCEHGDDDGRLFAAGVVVTRRTDDEGNPIGYLLMSSDTA
ncbi:MAG: hypothetical protein WA459_03380 [Stellaceae bacterium]